MNVIIIMACAIVGTIVLLLLIGISRWSFIYLIYYRLLKHEAKNSHYEGKTLRDALAVIIAIISLICFAIIFIYGVPYVIEYFPELKL